MYEVQLTVKLRTIELEQLEELVKQNQDLYESKAHFLRCATIRLINAHRRGEVKK